MTEGANASEDAMAPSEGGGPAIGKAPSAGQASQGHGTAGETQPFNAASRMRIGNSKPVPLVWQVGGVLQLDAQEEVRVNPEGGGVCMVSWMYVVKVREDVES